MKTLVNTLEAILFVGYPVYVIIVMLISIF